MRFLLIPLLLAGGAAQAAPQSGKKGKEGALTHKEEAKSSLSKAIHAYRLGFHKRAWIYLNHAARLAPGYSAARPEAHKLRALLLLAAGKKGEAAHFLVKSVALRPDPFLFYLLGSFNTSLRSTRQARNSYRRAAALQIGRDRTPPKGKAFPLLPSLLPFYCPGRGKRRKNETSRLKRMAENPFADFDRSNELWERGLHPLETAAAAFQSLVLTRALQRARAASGKNENEEELFRKARDLMTPRDRTTPPDDLTGGTTRFLRQAFSRRAHADCLRDLEQRRGLEMDRIRRGSLEPALKRIRALDEFLSRAHRNRIYVFGDLPAYYSYGSFLLQRRRLIEALHVYRKGLALIAPRMNPARPPENAAQAAQAFRGLGAVYRMLRRARDAKTVDSFADHLEDYLRKATPENEKKSREELYTLLRRSAILYLRNREGLLLLLAHAKQTGSVPAAEHYAKRLQIRDKKNDAREFLSVFRDL